MTYQTLQDFNASTPNDLLSYTAQASGGLFTTLLLMAVFSVTCFGIYFSGRRNDQGKFMGAAAVGSWFTLIVATALSIGTGIVDVVQISYCLIASVIFTLFFLLSD